MAIFLGLLAIIDPLKSIGGSFWLQSPEFWVYPLQTFLCGALLWFFGRHYSLGRPRRVAIAVAIALVVFLIWIAPQTFFAAAPRTNGYNPEIFAARPAIFWLQVTLRFARLVIVVPFMEEIFWRGFLLRYFINSDFERVEIGAFSWLSFVLVAIAFMFTHTRPDWPAALICAAAYNAVAYLTKSLASCVVAHAVTNLCLGLWIMHTQQWGFW
jgi:CAAX prenyl protease-like protein